jgi:hypothetical protein
MIRVVEGKCIKIMNLRICSDCHMFMKLVSKCEGKMIIVGDLFGSIISRMGFPPVATTGSQG